jgi:hypothetical protein
MRVREDSCTEVDTNPRPRASARWRTPENVELEVLPQRSCNDTCREECGDTIPAVPIATKNYKKES